jgi:hypothetical protein
MEFKFISYSGEYPNLCSGEFKFLADGKEYVIDGLVSGGYVSFDEEWNEDIGYGPWEVDIDNIPLELKMYHKEIVDLVNMYVVDGCCGGCV